MSKRSPEIRIDGNGNIVLIGSNGNHIVINKLDFPPEWFDRLTTMIRAMETFSQEKMEAAHEKLKRELFDMLNAQREAEEKSARNGVQQAAPKKRAILLSMSVLAAPILVVAGDSSSGSGHGAGSSGSHELTNNPEDHGHAPDDADHKDHDDLHDPVDQSHHGDAGHHHDPDLHPGDHDDLDDHDDHDDLDDFDDADEFDDLPHKGHDHPQDSPHHDPDHDPHHDAGHDPMS